ncbi:MAG: hypothetical protein KBT39_10065 [Bacteroidales bacterium]|nr:hypothetical protein [Bacteroidales bacterium]
MKKFNILLAALTLCGASQNILAQQDSLWVKYDNRFKANRFLTSIAGYDSIEFRATTNSTPLPVVRKWKDNTYSDFKVTGMTNNADGPAIVFGDPGLIAWKPTTSDANYNNDYTVDTNRWCFKHSRESEHFIVFWDKTFGEISGNKVTGSVSKLTVDINDLLNKAEKFYTTNVKTLEMCNLAAKSQLNTYKMAIYLLDIADWLATGSGNDNKIGTLWVSPSTCQPVGSTIAHEIGHSFQYQTYCDNILRGKPNDFKSGFRYGYPNSNGGCGFWEQCAQWQSYQDYPSEAINSYHFDVWINNCHRHFEHEWMRYASYWLHYYWTEKEGMTALGRIWNESKYPEDASQAYMRIFLNNDYEALRTQYFEYAQKAATFNFNAVKAYAGTKYNSYRTTLYNIGDGWKQIGYEQCPQPTGFNVIPYGYNTAGREVKVTLRALAAGSELPSGDPGSQVDGDGKVVGTTTNYNKTSIAGHETLAFGFVAIKKDGTRDYSPMTLATTAEDAVATYTIPANTTKVLIVVQGAPDKYFQCPWDDKEDTDNQLPYKIKIE